MQIGSLSSLAAGMQIPWGGTNASVVSDELAAAFESGDALIVVQDTGELIHLPKSALVTAGTAVTAAVDAFSQMGAVSDDQITDFYRRFASALADDDASTACAQA
jgi:glutamate-5-semialdehyde dehydrogenase